MRRRAAVRSPVILAVVVAMAVSCDDIRDQDAGTEEAADPEASAEPSVGAQAACGDVLKDVDGGVSALADMDVVSALEEIPQLTRTAAALSAPEIGDELESADEVTIFAPLDSDAQPTQGDAEDDAQDDDDTTDDERLSERPSPEPGAYVAPGGALSLDAIIEEGAVEVADGGVLTAEVDKDAQRVLLTREDASTEVICSDIEVRNGVIHIVDQEPVPVPEEDVNTESEDDDGNEDRVTEGVTPKVREEDEVEEDAL